MPASRRPGGYLAELVRHHSWATEQLLAFIATLPADRLKLTSPGTFGRLEITLAHLVKADGYYLELLTGDRRMPPLPALNTIADADVQDLIARAATNAEHFRELLARLPDPSALPDAGEGASAGHLFVQAIHHANEHRAQIGTILGASGIEPPDVSGWAFSRPTR